MLNWSGRFVYCNSANLRIIPAIAVATSDGAKASQEAPQKSVFERSSLS